MRSPAFLLAILCLAAPVLTGCQLVGGMMANAQRGGTRSVDAVYTGLQGKSFAVLVSADRAIRGEHPGLVERLAVGVTDRLRNPANQPTASGFVPVERVLRFQSDPNWPAKTYLQMAELLGEPARPSPTPGGPEQPARPVERLILVELNEYRLQEPGNNFEWAGLASATVSVIHTDTVLADTAAFTRTVNVPFPDERGMGPDQLSRQFVTSALSARLIDRVSWLFYRHDEPREITY